MRSAPPDEQLTILLNNYQKSDIEVAIIKAAYRDPRLSQNLASRATYVSKCLARTTAAREHKQLPTLL